MKRKLLAMLLVAVYALSCFCVFAEEGIFVICEVGQNKVVSTKRERIAAPRQSFYMYYNYGVTDADGNFIVEPVYDEISDFKDGRAMFRKDGKFGYFNDQWEIAIEPVYKSAAQFSEGLACVANDDNMYGFIDTDGNTVIPFEYHGAISFSNGIAYIYGEYIEGYNFNSFRKVGIIDKNGNIVEPLRFIHKPDYDVIMSENNVNINGTVYSNSELQYPFINYLGYTYIPLTYHGCREMGFVCNWSAEKGLVLENAAETPGSILGSNTMKRGEYFKALLYNGTLTIGDTVYTADDIYYPLLTWNDVVYMPVLWRQGMEALGLNYSYDLDSRSLVINIKR